MLLCFSHVIGWILHLFDILCFILLSLDTESRHRHFVSSINEPGKLCSSEDSKDLCFPHSMITSNKLLGDGHQIDGRRG
jgi:hypothetical protein